jgi:hypothetical protein
MSGIVLVVMAVIGIFVFRKSNGGLGGCLAALVTPFVVVSVVGGLLQQKSCSNSTFLPHHIDDVVRGVDRGEKTSDRNYQKCMRNSLPADVAGDCDNAADKSSCLVRQYERRGDLATPQSCRQNNQVGGLLPTTGDAVQHSVFCGLVPMLMEHLFDSCKTPIPPRAPPAGGQSAPQAGAMQNYAACLDKYVQYRLHSPCGTRPTSDPQTSAWAACAAGAMQADGPPAGTGPAYVQYCKGQFPTN